MDVLAFLRSRCSPATHGCAGDVAYDADADAEADESLGDSDAELDSSPAEEHVLLAPTHAHDDRDPSAHARARGVGALYALPPAPLLATQVSSSVPRTPGGVSAGGGGAGAGAEATSLEAAAATAGGTGVDSKPQAASASSHPYSTASSVGAMLAALAPPPVPELRMEVRMAELERVYALEDSEEDEVATAVRGHFTFRKDMAALGSSRSRAAAELGTTAGLSAQPLKFVLQV